MEQNEPTKHSHQVEQEKKRMSILHRMLCGRNRLFMLIVALPTILSAIYFSLIASDIYISESRFIIRNSQQRQPASGIGAALQATGMARALDDTYAIHDFILSRDALRQLDQQLGLTKSFGSSNVDRISRFGGLDPDKSFEALHRYYQKRIDLVLDTLSPISTLRVSAFSPEEALRINVILLDIGEKLVNRLNERSELDLMRQAHAEVVLAETDVKNTTLALSNYRKIKEVFDPEKQYARQLEQVTKLEEAVIESRTQLVGLISVAKKSPQVYALQTRIDTLNKVITEEKAKLSGGVRSLVDKTSEYEKLVIDRNFAEKHLATALTSLDQTRNDTQRKQLYLERIVLPVKPDIAVEPKRARSVFATFVISLICWGIVSLFIAGVREHND